MAIIALLLIRLPASGGSLEILTREVHGQRKQYLPLKYGLWLTTASLKEAGLSRRFLEGGVEEARALRRPALGSHGHWPWALMVTGLTWQPTCGAGSIWNLEVTFVSGYHSKGDVPFAPVETGFFPSERRP